MMRVAKEWSVSTFRTSGVATNPDCLLALTNNSDRVVLVKRVAVSTRKEVSIATVPIALKRIDAVSAGTVLECVSHGRAGRNGVVARGATASNGGAATAITFTVLGNGAYCRTLEDAIATGAGLTSQGYQRELVHPEHPIELQPGESVGVILEGATSGILTSLAVATFETMEAS